DMVNDNNGVQKLVPVRLSAFGAPPTQALMTVAELSPAARFGRGVRGLATGWGAAVVAVFLPILHLVLVPTFAVGGVVAAVVLGRDPGRGVALPGGGPRARPGRACAAGGGLRRTRLVPCSHCHTNVTLFGGAAPPAEPAPIAANAHG